MTVIVSQGDAHLIRPTPNGYERIVYHPVKAEYLADMYPPGKKRFIKDSKPWQHDEKFRAHLGDKNAIYCATISKMYRDWRPVALIANLPIPKRVDDSSSHLVGHSLILDNVISLLGGDRNHVRIFCKTPSADDLFAELKGITKIRTGINIDSDYQKIHRSKTHRHVIYFTPLHSHEPELRKVRLHAVK